MQISDILKRLPASLDWMVLFNLPAIMELADADTVRGMYHLPPETVLDPYSHVVLTSHGRFLATQNGNKLMEAETGEIWDTDQTPQSLGDRFSQRLALVAVDAADCLGLAEASPFSPVLLHLRLEGNCGKAVGIFDRAPALDHYELLQAVGVKFLGGETQDSYYLAHFQNRLPIHIHAGILSHFSRTAHCNIFFFRHGNIDAPLEAGLLQAAQVRVQSAQQRCLKGLAKLAITACGRSLSMTCQPPGPEPSFPYGDLVPLGFVLRALQPTGETALDDCAAAHAQLQAHVLGQQKDQLWAFHTQRLITATDSSLVLLGLQAPDSVAALERFADGHGGYYPQLWADAAAPGRMVLDASCRHWCQPDYATTCLVRSLRRSIGLPETTPIANLTAGFATRSGLYFANPYLMDWVLAEALRHDPYADELRDRLRQEVMASLNVDYSFGLYDVALSTALGILTLGALGVGDRTIRVLQLRLMELMNYPPQTTPAIPFYSTLRVDELMPVAAQGQAQLTEFFNRSQTRQKQLRTIAGQLHNISLYLDTHHMIATSLFALALAQPCDPTLPMGDGLTGGHRPSDDCHPRYRCNDHSAYIAKFALPPYLAV
jgi:hypothetical protein